MRRGILTAGLTIVLAGATYGQSLELRVGDSGVVEGDAGQRMVEVPVGLSAAPCTPVTVSFATRDGGADSKDSTTPQGRAARISVKLEDGKSRRV